MKKSTKLTKQLKQLSRPIDYQKKDEDGWFYKTLNEWEEETSLTR